MRAIVVLLTLQRHRARLQCQVQPHSHKQAQGTTCPGFLLMSDVGQQAQVIVSALFFAVLSKYFTEASANSTYGSRAGVTTMDSYRLLILNRQHSAIISYNDEIGWGHTVVNPGHPTELIGSSRANYGPWITIRTVS